MFPWEYARLKHSIELAVSPRRAFSTGELAKLAELQARFRGHPECVELDIDEQRLSFARWLVECGKLSEDI